MTPLDYTVLAGYMFANIAAFVLMGVDKWKAVRRWRRVPERALLLWCALLGALGGWLGIQVFRHKIRERKFTLGVPALLLAQAALLAVYLQFGR